MSVITYKCPRCGGALQFNPDTQKFGCEYCVSQFSLEELEDVVQHAEQNAEPHDSTEDTTSQNTKQAEKEFKNRTVAYDCPSCGAGVMTDDTTAATFCFYCHNPVVLSERLSGELKPDQIIPFAIKRDDALAVFMSWCKKKWFISKGFYSQSQLEKISGVYIPFWLTDCDISASIVADAKNVSTWRSGNTQYTKTKNYKVYRDADISFRAVPEVALKKTDEDLMNGMLPFDETKIVPFSMTYLSGFLAERYDMSKADVLPGIEQQLASYSQSMLHDAIDGYTSVSVENCNHSIKNTNYKYTLLPSWMLTYKYKNRIYSFAMNGQNGQSCGELPLNIGKLLAVCGGIFAVTFTILMLGGTFLW